MGNLQTIVSYGLSPEDCLNSLKCQVDYEWNGKLFVERNNREEDHPKSFYGSTTQQETQNEELALPILRQHKTRRFYVLNSNNQKCYVQFFKRTPDQVTIWKAVITL